MEITRTNGIGTYVVFPIINPDQRPSYLSGVSFTINVIARLYRWNSTASEYESQSINDTLIEEIGTTGLYTVYLSSSYMSNVNSEYPMIVTFYATDLSIDPQTIIIRPQSSNQLSIGQQFSHELVAYLGETGFKLNTPLIDSTNISKRRVSLAGGWISGDATLIYRESGGGLVNSFKDTVTEDSAGVYTFLIGDIPADIDLRQPMSLVITDSTGRGFEPVTISIRVKDATLESIDTKLGTITSIDGGPATVGSNLQKIAGTGFIESSDSLHQQAGQSTVQAVESILASDAAVITSGTIDSGDYTSTWATDNNYLQVSPDGVDPFEFYLPFQLGNKKIFNLILNGHVLQSGGVGTAGLEVFVYNWSTQTIEQVSGASNRLPIGTSSLDDDDRIYQCNNKYVSETGEVRVYGRSLRSNAGDTLFLDYVSVRATEAGLTVGDISTGVWQEKCFIR